MMQNSFIELITNLESLAKKNLVTNQGLITKLKKNPPVNLDYIFQALHERFFNEINCLDCGNCCKTLGPRITNHDIGNLSQGLRIKPKEFLSIYLRIDEDGDYVFKKMPCPFITAGNYCTVYKNRPKACREYPHTDRKKMVQILDITLKNTFICPVVFLIFEELKKQTGFKIH